MTPDGYIKTSEDALAKLLQAGWNIPLAQVLAIEAAAKLPGVTVSADWSYLGQKLPTQTLRVDVTLAGSAARVQELLEEFGPIESHDPAESMGYTFVIRLRDRQDGPVQFLLQTVLKRRRR